MSRKRRGRSEGSIFQRGDGTWTATISLGYTDQGKRKRKTVYGASKQEVQEKLRKLQQQADRGTLSDADQLKVSEYIDRWLNNTAKPKTSPTTFHRYEQHAKYIKEHLGSVKLPKLTRLHVEQLYAEMTEGGSSASEQQKVGKMLRQALKHAVDSDLIPNNPASKVALPRVDKKEIQPLDQGQAVQFLEAAQSDRLYAMYVLALDGGMRQGELFGLQWNDLDFDKGCVNVQRSLEELRGKLRLKDVKTRQARRRIDLSAFTLDALHQHRKAMLAEGHYRPDGQVFCDTQGGFLRKSNVSRYSFLSIIDRANHKAQQETEETNTRPALLPRIRFHDLRHTCATLLLLADENVKVVSERLGHAKIQITLDTYSHVLPTMQKRAAEKMDGLLRKKPAV